MKTSKGSDDADANDRFQAIGIAAFKREPPKIRDEDPDLDRYDMAFDNQIARHAYGRNKPRDIDILHWYGS